MSKDRIADSAKSLEKILSTDYEKLRLEQITEAQNRAESDFKEWFLRSALEPAEKKKQDDLKKHFSFHAGHCCECHKELKTVFPYDVNLRIEREKWGVKYEIHRQYACQEHQKLLKNKNYEFQFCIACHSLFYSYTLSKKLGKLKDGTPIGFCCSACRSYFDYHNSRQKQKPIACQHCKTDFIPKRTDSVFCSGKCRTASHRQKLKQTCNG